MEGELKEFHKTNTQLELKIAELNLKLKTKDKEMHKEMRKVSMCTVLDIFRVHTGTTGLHVTVLLVSSRLCYSTDE